MSNLLKDAIVDAKVLREAALKTAETTVIDKYAHEVRETLTKLLEQDEMEDPLGGEVEGAPEMDLGAPEGGMDPMGAAAEVGAEAEVGTGEQVAANIPLAATDNLSENEGENLNHLPRSGEDVDVEINLDALQEAVQTLQDEQEINLNEQTLIELLSEDEEDEEDLEEAQSAGVSAAAEAEADDDQMNSLLNPSAKKDDDENVDAAEMASENLDISDELIDEIVERLTVDMGATLSGWAGRSSEDMKYELTRALANRRSTDVQDDLEILKKAQEELVFENKQLKESLEQYKQATGELREGLNDVNLSNARLLYTNRVLRNTSLNERQKTKIADAISKAGSVTEAKTIYQTLESTVESTPMRGPQSLSEAIGRRGNSVLRASRKESTSSDPIADRMKQLAGIK
jgi:hypothetical protein|tara:strand:+ start:822 stop:2027 length:1206 start_codon:yes stop_codon:yes gene_type:complete